MVCVFRISIFILCVLRIYVNMRFAYIYNYIMKRKYSVDELNELKEKAKRIRELRVDNDFKAKEVYHYLNITQGQYSRIENGINELSYDGLIKLSLFYGVSIDYLLGLTNKREPYPRNNKKSV